MNFILLVYLIEYKIEDLQNGLKTGKYIHKKLQNRWSPVWEKFDGIFESESNIQIKCFFYCTACHNIEFNRATGCNTNRLLRHRCMTENKDENNNSITTMEISKSDKERLKSAAVKFIVTV